MDLVSFDPVTSWWLVVLFGLGVAGLTVWAYSVRIRTTTGAWRWFALGLRLTAILLCVIAALRPSVVLKEKRQQKTSLIFLLDDSSSMKLTDEVRSRSRWDIARKTLDAARETAAKLGDAITPKYYRFDSGLRELPEKLPDEPSGAETALGVALSDSLHREGSGHISMIVALTDGSNNAGLAPLIAARQLKAQGVPVVTVPFGSETAGANSREIAAKALAAAPTVFIKNQLQLKANIFVHGYANQTIEVKLFAEGETSAIATREVRVPAGVENLTVPFTWIPQKDGEKRLTLKVTPKDGELVQSNNEISTYVTVLKGGLNVLFVQGPHSPWEGKFWLRSVSSSPDIHGQLFILRSPARGGAGELKDSELSFQKYDVYILCDLDASYLTPSQRRLLAANVDKGAGLIMLGGLSSFGPGGWGSTELADVLPVKMRKTDGQLEPEGGVKFIPNPKGLESYLLQLAPTRAESTRVWNAMPPINGVSRFAGLKDNALVFGQTAGNAPVEVMIGIEAGKGRALAFAGETWVWPRVSEEASAAHRRFWRQVIFWLAHKEDAGANDVKLALDTRRVAAGQKLDFGVTARDAKGVPITGLQYESKVERLNPPEGTKPFSEPVENLFESGEVARGTFWAKGAEPGEYTVSVVAKKDGKEIGRDRSRFLVYQDDRELENPAADHALLRQVADASGGQSVAPEQLPKYLEELQGKLATETYTQTEKRVWDNWPFLLLFTTLLTVEWWVRKRHGWV